MISVSADDFNSEVLKSDVPVIVDFWADWCNPCKIIAPVLEDIEGDYLGKIKVVKVNADTEINLVHRYGVQSLPTVVLFDKGQEVSRFMGARPKPFILKEFAPFIP